MAHRMDAFVIIDLRYGQLHMVRLDPPLVATVDAADVEQASPGPDGEDMAGSPASSVDFLLRAAISLATTSWTDAQWNDLKAKADSAKATGQDCLVLRYDGQSSVLLVTRRSHR